MTGRRRPARVLPAGALLAFCLATVVTWPAAPASGQPVGYGDCEVGVLRPAADREGGDEPLVVTIRNRGAEPFGPVSVQLWTADTRVAQESTGALPPGVSTVVRLRVPPDAAGAYLIVGYAVRGVGREFAVPLPAVGDRAAGDQATGPPGGALLAWATPLLGFVGALLGVWLGHTTTARRERARMAADAESKRVDRDSPAYREFLDYWQASTSAAHLESAFDQLRSAVSVPAEIVREYDRTLGVLRDPGAGEDVRRGATARLHDTVEGLRVPRG